jgi:hypothetical protein
MTLTMPPRRISSVSHDREMKSCPKPLPKTTHPSKISQVSSRAWSMQPSMVSEKLSCSMQLTTMHPPQPQDRASTPETLAQLKPTEESRINHPCGRHRQFKLSKRMQSPSSSKSKTRRMRPPKTKMKKRQS